MREYVINGEVICDIASLCNEFARVVQAPDNYFGSDFQSFDDCLFGSEFGLQTPCTIIWQNHKSSEAALDASMLAQYCAECLVHFSAMKEDERASFSEGVSWCEETLNQAKSGKRTMFDEVIHLLESVSERSKQRREVKVVLERGRSGSGLDF